MPSVRILLVTQLFYPEPNHLKDLKYIKKLHEFGYSVEILTSFPNYPGGRIYPGYKQKWRSREIIDGVPVVRVPVFPDHSGSGFRRFLCYLSFSMTACIPGLFCIKKPDIIHVYQGPATLILPAILLKLFYRIPIILDIQDLWPDSVISSGMLKSKWILYCLNQWCSITYRFASKIIVLSNSYKKILIDRGIKESKIEVIYNWSNESDVKKFDKENISNLIFGPSNHFNIVYAGNIGQVQALDSVVHAFDLLKKSNPDVNMIFVGDGADKVRIMKLVKFMKLINVRFFPRQSINQISNILKKADALLIHLKDQQLCWITIPQKTQAYLAAGRPIIMAVRGEAADLIKQAKAGIICEPENPESIANAIVNLTTLSLKERASMGVKGKNFYIKKLSFHVGVKKMNLIYRSTIT